MAIKVKDGKREEFDYDYCKGCGICALECPGKKEKKDQKKHGESNGQVGKELETGHRRIFA